MRFAIQPRDLGAAYSIVEPFPFSLQPRECASRHSLQNLQEIGPDHALKARSRAQHTKKQEGEISMTATELDAIFGTGFSPVKEVSFSSYDLNRPATPVTDPNADVQEQDWVVDAAFANGRLTIAKKADGDGLWIPYLGNGSGADKAKGWGTYSRATAGKTWVATGKFSGCSIGMFSGGGGTRFAHLITPAAGHPCASVEAQAAAVSTATGLTSVTIHKPQTLVGEAIAFMLFLNGGWCKRIVQVQAGTSVVAIAARSTPFV